MGFQFELGFEKNNLLGNGIRTPPLSGPSQFVLSKDIFIFTAKWFLASCQRGSVVHLEYIYGNPFESD